MDITYFLQDKKHKKDRLQNKPINNKFIVYLNRLYNTKKINLLEFTDMMHFAKSGSIVNISSIIDIVNKVKEDEFIEFCYETFNLLYVNEGYLMIDINKIINNFIISKKGIIEFTDDQKNAIKEIITFLSDQQRKTFGLYGYAGTGKTTTIVEMISFLLMNKYINNIAFTAPTNKAVNVMKSKMRNNIKDLTEKICNKKYDINNFDLDDMLDELGKLGIKIDFITIHRLLNYKNDFDIEGERIFIRNGQTTISNYELVIIDECSMIPIEIITHLFEDIKDNHKKNPKIIFSGDPAQLPSVSQDISAIFIKKREQLSYDFFAKTILEAEKNIKFKYVQSTQAKGSVQRYNNLVDDIINMKYIILKEVVRNKLDNVVGLCYNIREWVENIIKVPNINKFIGKGVYVYNYDDKIKKIETKWFNKFITLQKNNTDNNISNIILTWTNKQTDEYNNAIRNIMFKEKKNIEKFEIGDILMLNDFYKFNETMVKDPDMICRFYTSEQIKVMDKDIIIKEYNEFMEQITKVMINMKNSDIIINKYKNLIKLLNTKTVRKYTIWKLTVQRMSEALIKDIIPELYVINVLHDQSMKTIETDKETSLDLIKKFHKTMINEFKDHEIKIDHEIILPLWRQWHKIFIDPFAKVNYGNSHSVHKSQGSSFYNVFVDSDDILNNKNGDEAKRCIYTALTRSSNEIHLLI